MALPILHYFDGYGRAECTRMIFKHLGVDFTDHRISAEEWKEIKLTGGFEFLQVPSLEIDGHHLVQTNSIERYLCKKFNLLPATLYEEYLVDSICDLKNDIVSDYLSARREENGVEKYKAESLPGKLKMIEKRLIDHGGLYFVGNSITRADFVIFQFVHDRFLRALFREQDLPYLELHAPRLVAYAQGFLEKSPNLQAYLQTRPERQN